MNPGLHSAHKVLVENGQQRGWKLVKCQIRKEERDVEEEAPSKDRHRKDIVRLLFQISPSGHAADNHL